MEKEILGKKRDYFRVLAGLCAMFLMTTALFIAFAINNSNDLEIHITFAVFMFLFALFFGLIAIINYKKPADVIYRIGDTLYFYYFGKYKNVKIDDIERLEKDGRVNREPFIHVGFYVVLKNGDYFKVRGVNEPDKVIKEIYKIVFKETDNCSEK